MSTWENPNFIKPHGYDTVKKMNSFYIDDLIKYINSIDKLEEYKIVDFGCGNGRITLDLKEKLDKPFKYIGIDCCKEIIEIAKKNNKDENISFFHMNIDEVDEVFLEKYKNFIFLFESTLCMVKDPARILKILSNISDNIVLTRLWLSKNNIFYNKPHKWDGFNELSYNWRFTYDYLHTNTSMKIINGIRVDQTDDAIMQNVYLKK